MLRNDIKMSQKAFGSEIGVSDSAISQIEKGKVHPSDTLIIAVCLRWNVNRKWLETGKGKMFLDEPASVTKTSQTGYHYDASICKAHPICQEICKLCHETPDDHKQEILEYIQFKQSLKPKRSLTGAKRGKRNV